MATTYTGAARSIEIYGNDATAQNLMTITNGVGSRVDVKIQKVCIYNDALAVLTAVMPIVKASRCTTSTISGGVVISKSGSFDTTQTSDANVVVRSAMLTSDPLTATPGDTIWQQMGLRMHTAVEQQRDSTNGFCVLPEITFMKPGFEFILHPGESMLLRVTAAATTSNAATISHWSACVEWIETSLSTFAISGTVTLGGSGVEGAKVIVIEADDEILTNGILREVITTPAGGAWSSTIKTGKVGAAFVQYKSGATYYTAPGSPFLS